jgi:trans-aconitate methyltransferase
MSDCTPSTPATHWDANLYDKKHAFVWKHGAALVELLQPQAGERILDLGCGTGHLTAQLAASGAEVIGIDSSKDMIDQARRAYPAIRFEVQDARALTFSEEFDGVFSNAVLHWIREPERVAACVKNALKPGGRFVAEFGGKGNVATIMAALKTAAQQLSCPAFDDSPWYYPSIGQYTSLLEQHGLEPTFATLFDRPTLLEGPQGLRNWVAMFRAVFLDTLPPEQREAFLSLVEAEARPTLLRDGVWYADYRRLRIVARRCGQFQ